MTPILERIFPANRSPESAWIRIMATEMSRGLKRHAAAAEFRESIQIKGSGLYLYRAASGGEIVPDMINTHVDFFRLSEIPAPEISDNPRYSGMARILEGDDEPPLLNCSIFLTDMIFEKIEALARSGGGGSNRNRVSIKMTVERSPITNDFLWISAFDFRRVEEFAES